MTDTKQPEAREFTMSQYASKDDMIGAMRKRIAELESELEAVGAGGVQALSAAPEIHEPKCPALDGAGCTCAKHDPTIDRAWAQFCGGIGDGLDAPYPGMISAFERYYSQSFADKAWRNEASVWAAAWKAALLAASPTPPAEQQAAPKAAPGDVLDEALRERDDSEDFIDALLDEVLGHERPEWSSSYGRADALNDVQERMTALHKPAVDKAWGRFQSAMAALQQDEPVGEVVSASCDHATVRWLHQTSSVGGGDPRNSRAWPKVSGVSRDESHSRALLVFFAAEPTDDEARAVHDTLAAAPTAMAAPRQEAQEPCGWDGAEEWEKLAWHLCAEENGEDACNELIWEGGPMPEPWGDRWLKYEGEARRMIDLVRTHVQVPQPAPVAQGDALPREDFAWLVVQEACETEPADEDDPECIRILRRDLKTAVLAAFLQLDAARTQAKEGEIHE